MIFKENRSRSYGKYNNERCYIQHYTENVNKKNLKFSLFDGKRKEGT